MSVKKISFKTLSATFTSCADTSKSLAFPMVAGLVRGLHHVAPTFASLTASGYIQVYNPDGVLFKTLGPYGYGQTYAVTGMELPVAIGTTMTYSAANAVSGAGTTISVPATVRLYIETE